jgi:hypothetical protein
VLRGCFPDLDLFSPFSMNFPVSCWVWRSSVELGDAVSGTDLCTRSRSRGIASSSYCGTWESLPESSSPRKAYKESRAVNGILIEIEGVAKGGLEGEPRVVTHAHEVHRGTRGGEWMGSESYRMSRERDMHVE